MIEPDIVTNQTNIISNTTLINNNNVSYTGRLDALEANIMEFSLYTHLDAGSEAASNMTSDNLRVTVMENGSYRIAFIYFVWNGTGVNGTMEFRDLFSFDFIPLPDATFYVRTPNGS